MSDLRAQLQQQAEAWRNAGLERKLSLPEGIDFCSNDYLGLSRDPRVTEAAATAARECGAGMPSARLLRGHLSVHEEAEREAAHWSGEESALLFPSGYQANLAMISALAGAEDVIVSDSLNHASLIDGIRLSRAQRRIVPHLDLAAYADALASEQGARQRFVVVEDVYSMDGDLAPLSGLLDLCERYDAWLLLDSAHAAGLLPMRGQGHARLLVRTITGGKALGLAGAFLCCSQEVRHHILNHGRSFLFTTAAPPPLAASLTAAIRIVQTEIERGQMALDKAQMLRQQLQEKGLDVGGEAAIVPVQLGRADLAVAVASDMQARGFDVRAVRPPTVPEGTSRLRLVVHADHAAEELQELADALVAAVEERRRQEFLDTAPMAKPAPGLIVAGTDTDVGKTVISALLARAILQRPRPLRYFKPLQTGDDLDTPTVARLANLAADGFLPPLAQLPLPASVDQAAQAAGIRLELPQLIQGVQQARQTAGEAKAHLLLECAGGLRVPINERADQLDLLQALRLPLVMVARSGLGTLNHTLLSLEACASRGMAVKALFLVGQSHRDNVASLRARVGKLPIYEVPPFKDLTPASLDLWLSAERLDFLEEMDYE